MPIHQRAHTSLQSWQQCFFFVYQLLNSAVLQPFNSDDDPPHHRRAPPRNSSTFGSKPHLPMVMVSLTPSLPDCIALPSTAALTHTHGTAPCTNEHRYGLHLLSSSQKGAGTQNSPNGLRVQRQDDGGVLACCCSAVRKTEDLIIP